MVYIASHIYEEIKMEELDTLRKQDRRSFKIENALISKKIEALRRGILNFIVGACMRRIQQSKSGIKKRKYSFVVHTEQRTQSHAWQEDIVIVAGVLQNIVLPSRLGARMPVRRKGREEMFREPMVPRAGFFTKIESRIPRAEARGSLLICLLEGP